MIIALILVVAAPFVFIFVENLIARLISAAVLVFGLAFWLLYMKFRVVWFRRRIMKNSGKQTADGVVVGCFGGPGENENENRGRRMRMVDMVVENSDGTTFTTTAHSPDDFKDGQILKIAHLPKDKSKCIIL
jgi:hypothetical protein